MFEKSLPSYKKKPLEIFLKSRKLYCAFSSEEKKLNRENTSLNKN